MPPDFSGTWKLDHGASRFGFLPPPRLRIDTIVHQEPYIRIRTRQYDASGLTDADRNLTIGGQPIEVEIRGRSRRVRAFWLPGAERATLAARKSLAESVLVVETTSEVSGRSRTIEDRWTLDGAGWLRIERRWSQPGGAVRQFLVLRRHGEPSALSAPLEQTVEAR
ncbi:MAG: hypothetical protein R2762_25470 [Bryobacteraceae bacterium]